MTSAPEGALDVGLRLAAILDDAAVPYALGGALALGVWGVPRGTMDVDINVFVAVDEVDATVAALESAGVDLFTASIDFAWEAKRTRVRHTVEDRSAWFLSAEALAVFKLLFFRGKDARVQRWDEIAAAHRGA